VGPDVSLVLIETSDSGLWGVMLW